MHARSYLGARTSRRSHLGAIAVQSHAHFGHIEAASDDSREHDRHSAPLRLEHLPQQQGLGATRRLGDTTTRTGRASSRHHGRVKTPLVASMRTVSDSAMPWVKSSRRSVSVDESRYTGARSTARRDSSQNDPACARGISAASRRHVCALFRSTSYRYRASDAASLAPQAGERFAIRHG